MLEFVLIFSGLFLLLIVFLYWQNKGLRLHKIFLENKKLPKGFSNYKILHISDFHNDKSLLFDTIKLSKKEKPDIIFITGDIIDSRKTDIKTAINLLEELNKIASVYYVVGNHENRIKNLDAFINEVKVTNTKVLNNEKIIVEKDGDFISLIGLSDPNFSKINREKEEASFIKTIKKLSFGDNTFKLLLVHRPEYFLEYTNAKYDLIFSGHAHGGQFSIPFTDIGVFVPDQGFFAKYCAGVKEKENTKMIINRGIGNSLFPFRLFNRPEVILLTLKNS